MGGVKTSPTRRGNFCVEMGWRTVTYNAVECRRVSAVCVCVCVAVSLSEVVAGASTALERVSSGSVLLLCLVDDQQMTC